MAKEVLTYTEALTEVERIIERIGGEEIAVDELSQAVKRATELLAQCRAQLQKSEEEVAKILE